MAPMEDRLKRLEEHDDKNVEKFSQILSKLSELKAIASRPHECMWVKVIPSLIDFKKDSVPIHNNIFKRLDKTDDEIDKLKESHVVQVELNKKLTEYLDKHEKDEKDKADKDSATVKEHEAQTFSVKQGVLLIIISIIGTYLVTHFL